MTPKYCICIKELFLQRSHHRLRPISLDPPPSYIVQVGEKVQCAFALPGEADVYDFKTKDGETWTLNREKMKEHFRSIPELREELILSILK